MHTQLKLAKTQLTFSKFYHTLT